jgi:hypothetical protein
VPIFGVLLNSMIQLTVLKIQSVFEGYVLMIGLLS